MNEKYKTIICIIGMHRSGTSMVAQVLHRGGLYLGAPDQLLGSNDSNPFGHFEHKGFIEINDALLSHFGGSWDNPPPLKEGWENDTSLEPMVREAKSLIDNFSLSSYWGWKDPRTTILLPFWKSLIPNLRFVICLRSPLEVAKSLALRDGISIQKSDGLWNEHIWAAIRDTEGYPRIFSFYEDFFKETSVEISRLLNFCGIENPKEQQILNQIVSRELKRHTSEMGELLKEDKITTASKLFYIGLRALSVPAVLSSEINRSQEQTISDNMGRFFKLIENFHNEHETVKLQAAFAQKDVQITQLQSTVQSQQEVLEEKEQQVVQLQITFQAQRRALAEMEQQVAQLKKELAAIYSGLSWKLMNRFWSTRDRFLPRGSIHRELYDGFLSSLKRKSYPSDSKELSGQLAITAESSYWDKWNTSIYSILLSVYDTLKKLMPPKLRSWLIPRLGKIGIFVPLIKIKLKNKLKPDYEVRARFIYPRFPVDTNITRIGPADISARLVGQCKRFAIYTNSLGNYFFNEMRDLLAAGLGALGFEVMVVNEKNSFINEADWHIVMAPHEFFYLGSGRDLDKKGLPSNLILINTEQPSTQWFALAKNWFSKAHCIWDINYSSAELIQKKGFRCEYLPLGYVSSFPHFGEVKELQDHYGTCFLESSIRKISYFHEPLSRRPLDLFFVGYLSPRREKFFAKEASVLSKYRNYFYFWDASEPIVSGKNTYMNTNTVIGLAQRSKILLNIHHGKDKYFEWQRIVMHGIWQKSLVISEPCGAAPPFQPGVDYVEASLAEIPDMIEFHLSTDKGREDGEAIIRHGYQTLMERCKLTDQLQLNLSKL